LQVVIYVTAYVEQNAGRNPANNENSVTAVFVAIRRIGAADWWPLQAPADTPETAGLKPPELPAS